MCGVQVKGLGGQQNCCQTKKTHRYTKEKLHKTKELQDNRGQCVTKHATKVLIQHSDSARIHGHFTHRTALFVPQFKTILIIYILFPTPNQQRVYTLTALVFSTYSDIIYTFLTEGIPFAWQLSMTTKTEQKTQSHFIKALPFSSLTKKNREKRNERFQTLQG